MSATDALCWALLAAMALSLVAADCFERAGDRLGVAACVAALVIASVAAIALACARHPVELSRELYSPEHSEWVRQTRDWTC